jgi:hypothetical protein
MFIWSILYLKKLRIKSNKYKFIGYPKGIIGYYLHHLVEKKCLSQYILPFLKKKLFLKGVVRGKIELDEVQEPQIEI